jgi:hypothetical protein
MARSKALINAGMPVYFVWNRKSHISNGTAKSVGSHNVSNSESGGVSVDDYATTEILVSAFDAVPGPVNAGMPVYFIWNRKSHISNGTAKSVGSHSVSNTRCHSISVDDCAKTENLYTA